MGPVRLSQRVETGKTNLARWASQRIAACIACVWRCHRDVKCKTDRQQALRCLYHTAGMQAEEYRVYIHCAPGSSKDKIVAASSLRRLHVDLRDYKLSMAIFVDRLVFV